MWFWLISHLHFYDSTSNFDWFFNEDDLFSCLNFDNCFSILDLLNSSLIIIQSNEIETNFFQSIELNQLSYSSESKLKIYFIL